MMTWIVLFVILLIAAILIYGLMQPSQFVVSRMADMKATPAAVFAQINDFHNWAAWSPWEKIDPGLQRSFTGEATGVGAQYAWVGNKKVGQGNMEITQAETGRRVALDLHFVKPFQAHNVAVFTLSPTDSGTQVKWEMSGHTPFLLRVMKVFMDMDKMVGKDFETGLANLKAVVEK